MAKISWDLTGSDRYVTLASRATKNAPSQVLLLQHTLPGHFVKMHCKSGPTKDLEQQPVLHTPLEYSRKMTHCFVMLVCQTNLVGGYKGVQLVGNVDEPTNKDMLPRDVLCSRASRQTCMTRRQSLLAHSAHTAWNDLLITANCFSAL